MSREQDLFLQLQQTPLQTRAISLGDMKSTAVPAVSGV